MFNKILMGVAMLAGGLIGGYGAWIFHYILDVNAPYISNHKPLEFATLNWPLSRV
jgi:hypothetical protein